MSRPVTILAALSSQELGEFLPGRLLEEAKALATRFDHLETDNLTCEEFSQRLARCESEILLTCWKTPPLPAQLPPSLRYVCHLSGSIRKVVTREHLERGLLVSNWGGSISRIVAEWALFHVLSCLRRATFWTLAMHQQAGWKNGHTETASLFGRRVGLHGFGQVARELTGLLRAFSCEISAFAPDVDAATEARFGIKRANSLEELFGENEIIVELAPLIPATLGCVSESLLRRIPPGGVFVNVGRGAVVDEDALVRIAREGKIMVGLDVFTVEPLPPDSGLRGLPNVTLTPHLAGPTTDRRRDAGQFALENLRAYVSGQPLKAVITPRTFDGMT
ncbi:MAG: hydroxyacid dehydrogenase [Opitutaceae bacterium]